MPAIPSDLLCCGHIIFCRNRFFLSHCDIDRKQISGSSTALLITGIDFLYVKFLTIITVFDSATFLSMAMTSLFLDLIAVI
jgi:hypothetical protein